ncbi:hypothetical protein Ahy_B01g053181 [Arachis hypogaea]|uniref:TF-B3 domain-containing protein n=1 Tax=Arachis hypogaea TaxID=3818 RepID=A0A445ARB1_ARAHY|nr:hypothetical protein Ahy_B01g053181 [Arachis hypogaea]
MAEENAKGDVVRVIKAAEEPSCPMRLPLPNGLLPKGSNQLYVTVADGSNRTYKIACSPKGWKEITLGRGWQRFYHEYKLQPSNILLFKHKGRYDFSVHIFQSPGVERTYVTSGGDSGDVTPPRCQGTIHALLNHPRVERGASISPGAQLQLRWSRHFSLSTPSSSCTSQKPNVLHFGDDVNDDMMVTLRAGEISVRAVYGRYGGNRRRNCGTISGGWADFLRKCNISVPKLAVFEISSTHPDVELLVQFVDFE